MRACECGNEKVIKFKRIKKFFFSLLSLSNKILSVNFFHSLIKGKFSTPLIGTSCENLYSFVREKREDFLLLWIMFFVYESIPRNNHFSFHLSSFMHYKINLEIENHWMKYKFPFFTRKRRFETFNQIRWNFLS